MKIPSFACLKNKRFYLTIALCVVLLLCCLTQSCFVLDWIRYNDDKGSFDIKDDLFDAPFRGAEWKFRIKGNELFIGLEHKF